MDAQGYRDDFFVESEAHDFEKRRAEDRERTRVIARERQRAMGEQLTRQVQEQYFDDILDTMEDMEVWWPLCHNR